MCSFNKGMGAIRFRLGAQIADCMPRMIVGLVNHRSKTITANEEYALAA